jgi:hypothetical protein
MILSPMLIHANESFQHGLEHFSDGSDKGRKFSILHIDQAIELYLKEKCIQLGKSIYKSDGTTITFHEALNSLVKDIKIPERPRLEELHDLRNTIQHKGLLPDSITTSYFIENAFKFTKRFLKEELDISINDVLTIQNILLMETTDSINIPDEILTILENAKSEITPLGKIIAGFTALEKIVALLTPKNTKRLNLRGTLRSLGLSRGIPIEKINRDIDSIFVLRNRVVHSDYRPNEKEAKLYLNSIKQIIDLLNDETTQE